MRFSANLGFLWPDRPMLARIDAAAAAGFRAIELHWPYDIPADLVRARCDRHALTLLGINTAVGAASGDFGLGAIPGREAEFRDGFTQAACYARDSGGSAVHVMAGVVPAGAQGAAADTFAANLGWAAAEAPDLTLLLEPINRVDKPGYFYADIPEVAAMIERVGAPNLRIMFDAYHVGMGGRDVLAELGRHFAKVGHVQIAAVPSRAEPDEGSFAFPPFFAALDRLGYTGWIGCEYRPRGDTSEGLRWLRALEVSLEAD